MLLCLGDWLISIQYNGQNIKGSPFHVRVYDPGQVKVYGLEGGNLGTPVKFTGMLDLICNFLEDA